MISSWSAHHWNGWGSLQTGKLGDRRGRTGQQLVWSNRGSCCCCCKSLQSCPTLCDPIDGSPPGSPIPGILQARTLEWAAISFSNAWKWKLKVKSLSHVRLFVAPWTAAYQTPLSMGFSRQEYWSGVLLPSLNRRKGGFIVPLYHPSQGRATLKDKQCHSVLFFP